MGAVKQALPLRPYQREALDALRAKLSEELHNRQMIVLPTGAGKTVCFAHASMEFLAEHADKRVLVLVHTDELVQQARTRLLDVAPHLSVGIVKGKHDETTTDVIVASVATLRSKVRRDRIRHVGLVIVDECHHALASTYMAILEHFGCLPGRVPAVGFTATPMRGDGKSLAAVWQELAYQRDISWMVRRQYLINPIGIAVVVEDLDLRNVKATRADYREGELGEALAQSLAPETVAKAYVEHAKDRRGILFAPTVASAEVFAQALEDEGISAALIHGGLSDADRGDVIERHKSGLVQVLCNCMVLTEGYDDPKVSCIVIARPTKSKGLYIQMAGRGLRPDLESPVPIGEQDCLLLDVCGASEEHDLRSIVDLSEKPLKKQEKKDGEPRSLVDLEDEFDAGFGADADEQEWYAGEVVTREFDPLGRPTTKTWLRTKAGVYFMPAGRHLYVMIIEWPESGQHTVAWCTVSPQDRAAVDADGIPRIVPTGRQAGITIHKGLPLEEALVWAGEVAQEAGADLNTTNLKAPWRKKLATEKTIRFARTLGIPVEQGVRSGELSDRIATVMGTRRIDPVVKQALGRR